MRTFCWTCHRPTVACFCALSHPFTSSAEFAVVVHPHEVQSTVGTAWILRRSISNLIWIRSNGIGLDQDSHFRKALDEPGRIPVLLFPSSKAFNLNQGSAEDWSNLIPSSHRPLFIVIDGTWTQARVILRRSAILRSLPCVSFDTVKLSEYGFKKQPHPACLSSVEGIHRVIEVLALRGWGRLPASREHDQMIEIFKSMVQFQIKYRNKNSAYLLGHTSFESDEWRHPPQFPDEQPVREGRFEFPSSSVGV